MLEQVGNSLSFTAFYTASGVGKTGLADVTIDVYGPDLIAIVTAGPTIEVGGGLYVYALDGIETATEGEYRAVFKTSDGTVDAQHLHHVWTVGRGGIEDLIPLADTIDGLLDRVIATSPIEGSVEHALLAALAAGFGKLVRSEQTLTLYTPDGSSEVHRFTLSGPPNGPATARSKAT
jgi:hypothetical protein